MVKLLAGLAVLLGAAAMTPLAIIALSAPKSPPPMTSMAVPPSVANLPEPRTFRARDGIDLQYYAYPAQANRVAVLMHGSVGPGKGLNPLAQSLQAAGITTYVPDVRGHGGSGVRGDIEYIGQIDDDLADFVSQLGPAKSEEIRILADFSAGAGFTIRFAGGPFGSLFDRYVFLSPILPGAPTLRPNAGGWTNISLPRIVTINYLDRAGIHWLDGFPVISYATSPKNTEGTRSYSYRLAANFGAGTQYESYLRNIHRPSVVIVGSADEQVFPDQFAPLLQRLGLDIPVITVPGMKHADMIAAPAALQAIVRVINQEQPA